MHTGMHWEILDILDNPKVSMAERYASILSAPRLVQLLAHDDAVIPDGLITKLNMQVYSMEDFTDVGNGIVMDTRTNLQWMRWRLDKAGMDSPVRVGLNGYRGLPQPM